MDFCGDELRRIALAPAKLNLFLEVLGRRADGFHHMETVMVPIHLADSLTFQPLPIAASGSAGQLSLAVKSGSISLENSDFSLVPRGSKNLILLALELLRLRSGCELGGRVELVKRIPLAAGLGGGSSDAATALRLANHAWGLHWSTPRLATLAAEIGSDVPFFLAGGAAVCRGCGELVERLPALPTLHFVVVKPPVALSTREVYQTYANTAANVESRVAPATQMSDVLNMLVGGTVQTLGGSLFNRLQAAASLLSSWVERLHRVFSGLDCLGHQLSGSGSAYFGLCRHAQHARRLATFLRSRQLGIVYATRSGP